MNLAGYTVLRKAARGLAGLLGLSLIGILTTVLVAAQGGRVIGRLAPGSDFPDLPTSIAQDLASRGCQIPQVKGVSSRHNVMKGAFEKPGQLDWAVLCLQKNTSTILVYWKGSVQNPAQLAPLDETITPSKNGYYRILQAVDEKFIRGHYDASATDLDPLPKTLDHDGIDDGISEKGSIVHYFYNGAWLKLAGSD